MRPLGCLWLFFRLVPPPVSLYLSHRTPLFSFVSPLPSFPLVTFRPRTASTSFFPRTLDAAARAFLSPRSSRPQRLRGPSAFASPSFLTFSPPAGWTRSTTIRLSTRPRRAPHSSHPRPPRPAGPPLPLPGLRHHALHPPSRRAGGRRRRSCCSGSIAGRRLSPDAVRERD